MKKVMFANPLKTGMQIALLLVIALYNFMPGVTTVVYAAPSNDNIANALTIGSLPFSDTEDTTTAVSDGDGPLINPVCEEGVINRGKRNVWYKYTSPTAQNVSFDTFGSTYDTYIAMWTGPNTSNLSLVGCDDDTATGYQSQLVVKLTAGVVYYIEAAEYAGVPDGNPPTSHGGTLQFHAQASGGPDTTGVFRPSNGLLYLKNQNTTGFADIAINYGLGGDYPVVGDWDGNGTATIGIYRNGSFYLRNSNTLGFANMVFPFGQVGDQPIAGDWNGDGIDTIGIFRPSNGQFLLRNSNDAGPADAGSFFLGNPGDVGIAGDWTGKGYDTVGVFRPSNGVIFLKNTNQTGFADIALNYGIPGDRPITGDWNDDGKDTIGVYRNGQFLLRNTNDVGFADISFGLGNPGDMPIAGNWDGIP